MSEFLPGSDKKKVLEKSNGSIQSEIPYNLAVFYHHHQVRTQKSCTQRLHIMGYQVYMTMNLMLRQELEWIHKWTLVTAREDFLFNEKRRELIVEIIKMSTLQIKIKVGLVI